MGLGGGRRRAADAIDFAVGLSGFVAQGESVKSGGPLAFVHARSQAAAEVAATAVRSAITIVEVPPDAKPVVYKTVRE